MDSRIALCGNTQLRFQNKEGGAVLYTIVKEISRGGSCIVYDASYETNSGDTKRVRIKECYPSKLQITRCVNNHLLPSEPDADAFDCEKKKFRSNFSLGNGLFYAEGLFDALTNTIDIYDGNGTTYLVSTYSPECTLATYRPLDIRVCIALTKQVAHILKRIHTEGYVYLDIKPENVLVSDSYTTRVQLFDFDSLIPMAMIQSPTSSEIGNIRLSYSKGFAAIELQTAKFRKLGVHTDVYGVGALMFYLLFGVTPTAADCEPNATFDYTKMLYLSEHQDKLYFALTEFFHNALANFYLDRYHDMQQVIDALADIERLADDAVAYIRSTKVSAPSLFVGRNEEIQQIFHWYTNDDSQCLLVTGMGGIGKSTVVRAFLSHYRQHFDHLLYLPFKNSLPQTLADDYAAGISTTSRDPNESFADYYKRKLLSFKNIVAGSNSLLVIDNYNGEVDGDLLDILQVGWKVILISRRTPPSDECTVLPISEINDTTALYCLFEHSLGRSLTSDELPFVDNIIRKIEGHTLVLDLIAKQLGASYMSIETASALVDEYGFANIAREKIAIQKDAVVTSQTIRNFITALFEANQLLDTKRSILKAVSLLDADGIDINLLHELLGIAVKDATNELAADGWLQIDGKKLSMHPVIKEAVHCWVWTDDAVSLALIMTSQLSSRLKATGYCGGSPALSAKQKRVWPKPFIDKWIERVNKLCSEEPADPPRAYSCSSKRQNLSEAQLYLRVAEGMIASIKREPPILVAKEYTDLLYYTVINMPRYRESFILEHSLMLIDTNADANGVALMQLYRSMLSIYQEQKTFDAATMLLQKAKATAVNCNDNFVYALYYDVLSEFYDHVLNGAYDAVTHDDVALFKKMRDATDRSIQYAKKVDDDEGVELLAKNLLAKATLIIRNNPNRKNEIDRILKEAKTLVDKFTSPYTDLRSHYHMVCAWYHTLVTHSFEATIEHVERANDIAKKVVATDLDFIDDWVVPCADIFCNWQEYETSLNLLNSAWEMCARKKEVIPYIRKGMELGKYQVDVCCEWGKQDLARKLLKDLDMLNAAYASIGVTVDIPQDLRDYLS